MTSSTPPQPDTGRAILSPPRADAGTAAALTDGEGANGSGDAPLSAWYALALLVFITLLAVVDRQIIVLLAEPLRAALGLSDAKLGMLLGVGLALFVGIAAYPVGWLADRFDRRLVIIGCILVWSLATAACGLSRNFWQLMVATMFLGIGEAGLAPTIYGLIPELFHHEKRPLANAIFAVASSLAGGVGYGLSGILLGWLAEYHPYLPPALQSLESWRLSFLLVALPGPLAMLLMATLRAGRPAKFRAAASAEASLVSLEAYLRGRWPLLLRFFLGYGLGNLGFSALGSWMPIAASRIYHASAREVGAGMATASVAGLLIGFAGGSLYHRILLPRLGAAATFHVIWLGFLLAAIPAIATAAAGSADQLYLLTGAQIAAVMAGVISFPTVVQDLAPAAIRSRLLAIGVIVVVATQASGPVLVGVVSDHLQAVPNGLLTATALIGGAGLLGGGFLLRASEGSFMRSRPALL